MVPEHAEVLVPEHAEVLVPEHVEVNASGLELAVLETAVPLIALTPDLPFGDVSDSHSAHTEPIILETDVEDASSKDIFKIIKKCLFPEMVPNTKAEIRRRDFIISEIQDTLNELSPTRPISEILDRHDYIL